MKQQKIFFVAVLVFLVGMALSIKLSADSTPADNNIIIVEGLDGKLLVKSEKKQQKENEQWTEERENEPIREEGDGKYKPTKKAGGQSDKSIVYPNRGSAYKRCLDGLLLKS